MRRGIAGMRLCDRPACAHRWPCAVHGTATVGDYEHLGRHAGAFDLAEVPGSGGVLDVVWCGHCRMALCSCCDARPRLEPLVEPSLRPGWTTDGQSYFNDSIALMVCRGELGRWHVCGNGSPWPQGFQHTGCWFLPRNAMHFAEIFALTCAQHGLVACP